MLNSKDFESIYVWLDNNMQRKEEKRRTADSANCWLLEVKRFQSESEWNSTSIYPMSYTCTQTENQTKKQNQHHYSELLHYYTYLRTK